MAVTEAFIKRSFSHSSKNFFILKCKFTLLCLTQWFSCTLNGEIDCAVFLFIYLIWVCVYVCIRFHCLDIKNMLLYILCGSWCDSTQRVSHRAFRQKRKVWKMYCERECEPIRIRTSTFSGCLALKLHTIREYFFFFFFSNGMWNLVVFVNTMWCKYACYMYALYIPNKFL